ncbi:MAG: tetratricopeptide repeat protein [bacterium]
MKNKLILSLILLVSVFTGYLYAEENTIKTEAKVSEEPLAQAKKYFDMGRYEEAIKIYNMIKIKYPDSKWALDAQTMAAKTYEKQGHLQKAIDEYTDIINKNKESEKTEEVFFDIGRLLSDNQQIDRAINAYNLYTKRFPSGQFFVVAVFNMASLQKEKEDTNAALKNYEIIMTDYPHESWFYNWSAIYSGHIYYKRKEYSKALGYYERVSTKADNKYLKTLATLYMGMVYMDTNKIAEAKNVFQTILKTTNIFTEEALLGLGNAHYKAKEFEEASEVYQSLMDMYPDTNWKNDIERKLENITKTAK